MGTTVVVTVNSGRGISMSACKCSDVYCTGALHDVKNIECAVPRNSGESIQVFFKQQSSTSLYRSRQYYESKVLHNTEVAWFLTACCSLKMQLFIQNVAECRSPIQHASFDTFKAEIGQLFVPQSTF